MNAARGLTRCSQGGSVALGAAALTLLSSLAVLAQATIEVASIRENPNPVTLASPRMMVFEPGRLRANNFSVEYLVGRAYGLQTAARRRFILGWPNTGIKDRRFDIAANLMTTGLTLEERQRVVRELLTTRFGFKAHTEQRQVSAYRLMLVKPGVVGPGLTRVDFDCSQLALAVAPKDKDGRSLCAGGNYDPVKGILSQRGGGNMQALATQLEGTPGGLDGVPRGGPLLPREERIVVDGTGLDGLFVWDYPSDGDRFTNLRQHLGLKLEAVVTQVPVIVIDRVQMPTPN